MTDFEKYSKIVCVIRTQCILHIHVYTCGKLLFKPHENTKTLRPSVIYWKINIDIRTEKITGCYKQFSLQYVFRYVLGEKKDSY